MTAPNIVSPTSIVLKNASAAVGTAESSVVTCPSGKALKVSTLYAANVHGTTPGDLSVRLSSPAGTHAICSTVSVPADSSLIVVDREAPVYLEEGHSILAVASAAGVIQVVVSYEEIA
jgi:hypothetical protein